MSSDVRQRSSFNVAMWPAVSVSDLILLIVGVLFLISGLANDPRAAWPYWIIWIATTGGYLLLRQLDIVLDWLLLVFCLIVALVAIGQVAGWWLGLRVAGMVRWAPSSFVNSCNILGELMVWGVVLAAKMQRRESVIVCIAALLLSGSRTSWMAMIAVAAIYLWNKGSALIMILPMVIVALVVGIYFYTELAERAGIELRTDPWIATIASGGKIIGYGPGHIKEVLPSLTVRHNWHAHNILLQAWGDLGFVGVISVIGLGWFVIDDVIKSHSVWLEMFVGASLVAGIFEYLYWLPGLGLLALLFYDRLRQSRILYTRCGFAGR